MCCISSEGKSNPHSSAFKNSPSRLFFYRSVYQNTEICPGGYTDTKAVEQLATLSGSENTRTPGWSYFFCACNILLMPALTWASSVCIMPPLHCSELQAPSSSFSLSRSQGKAGGGPRTLPIVLLVKFPLVSNEVEPLFLSLLRCYCNLCWCH